MPDRKVSRGYFHATFGCYCPRCREGKLFKHRLSFKLKRILAMNTTCPVCSQPTEIEVGFYYGTSYVSYLLTILISVASLLAWWIFVGLSVNDNRFFFWVGFNAGLLLLLQPWLMRVSRSLWISWFVKYDPDWADHRPGDVSERLNAEHGSNW